LANVPLNKLKNQLPAMRRNTSANTDYSSGSNNWAAAYTLAVQPTCEMCEGAHSLVKCRNLNNASVVDTQAVIKDRSLLCLLQFEACGSPMQRDATMQEVFR
jgi:hypothetical protein